MTSTQQDEPEGAEVPGQEQQRSSRREKDDVEQEVEPLPRTGTQTDADDVDALLDEIDDVLESNAEQFVRQYTQKGGQ